MTKSMKAKHLNRIVDTFFLCDCFISGLTDFLVTIDYRVLIRFLNRN